jgi:hypothetical protein
MSFPTPEKLIEQNSEKVLAINQLTRWICDAMQHYEEKDDIVLRDLIECQPQFTKEVIDIVQTSLTTSGWKIIKGQILYNYEQIRPAWVIVRNDFTPSAKQIEDAFNLKDRDMYGGKKYHNWQQTS